MSEVTSYLRHIIYLHSKLTTEVTSINTSTLRYTFPTSQQCISSLLTFKRDIFQKERKKKRKKGRKEEKGRKKRKKKKEEKEKKGGLHYHFSVKN